MSNLGKIKIFSPIQHHQVQPSHSNPIATIFPYHLISLNTPSDLSQVTSTGGPPVTPTWGLQVSPNHPKSPQVTSSHPETPQVTSKSNNLSKSNPTNSKSFQTIHNRWTPKITPGVHTSPPIHSFSPQVTKKIK